MASHAGSGYSKPAVLSPCRGRLRSLGAWCSGLGWLVGCLVVASYYLQINDLESSGGCRIIAATQTAFRCNGTSYDREIKPSNGYPLIVCEGCEQPREGVFMLPWAGETCNSGAAVDTSQPSNSVTVVPSVSPTGTPSPTMISYKSPKVPCMTEGFFRYQECRVCAKSTLPPSDLCNAGTCVSQLWCQECGTHMPNPVGSTYYDTCIGLVNQSTVPDAPVHEPSLAPTSSPTGVPSSLPTRGRPTMRPALDPTSAPSFLSYARKESCSAGLHRVAECLPCSKDTLSPNYLCSPGECVMEHWCAPCGDYYPFPVGNEKSVCP
jgi:hypothetical protein